MTIQEKVKELTEQIHALVSGAISGEESVSLDTDLPMPHGCDGHRIAKDGIVVRGLCQYDVREDRYRFDLHVSGAEGLSRSAE